VLLTTFTADGVEMGGPPSQLERKTAFDAQLRPRLRPACRHLVPLARGCEQISAPSPRL
jgi:hypothetical protein